jgi:hypothetical protein
MEIFFVKPVASVALMTGRAKRRPCLSFYTVLTFAGAKAERGNIVILANNQE